ncbi:MAG: type II TA system antitoxin MqsA family protein [Gemmatimonadota bacterium]
MKKTECGICGGEAVLVNREREVRVGKRSAVVEDEFFQCNECGEELYEPGQMDAVMLKASTAIREELGLLMPEEIKAIRESLELTQSDFEQLLSVGEKTVVRWERGTVFQNSATDILIRTVRDVKGVSEFLGVRADLVLPAGTVLAQFDLGEFIQLDPAVVATTYLATDELVEADQYVPAEQTFSVKTGGYVWAKAA